MSGPGRGTRGLDGAPPGASPPPSPLLEVADLRKAFGGIRAVDGIALTLTRGEIRALIGPNGAGKTTLFELLTGHLVPDAGHDRHGTIGDRARHGFFVEGP